MLRTLVVKNINLTGQREEEGSGTSLVPALGIFLCVSGARNSPWVCTYTYETHHTRTCVCTYICMRVCTSMHMPHTDTYTCTRIMHTHTHTHPQAHMCMHAHTWVGIFLSLMHRQIPSRDCGVLGANSPQSSWLLGLVVQTHHPSYPGG